MKKPHHLIAWFMCITSLTACGIQETKPTATNEENLTHVVWADDASELAIVSSSASPKAGLTHQHQIFSYLPTGERKRPLTGLRNDKLHSLSYMKQAGYLVAESITDDGTHRFDKISLNGSEILIIEVPARAYNPCGSDDPTAAQTQRMVIPSPDGQQLAHVYSPECGAVSVEFLHAHNLNFIDSQSIEITEPVYPLWHPNGYLVLTNGELKKAWGITVRTKPQETIPPNCIKPTTTSSPMSSTGQFAYIEAGELKQRDVGKAEAFGCQ